MRFVPFAHLLEAWDRLFWRRMLLAYLELEWCRLAGAALPSWFTRERRRPA